MEHNRGYLGILFAVSAMMGFMVFLSAGCGNSYGTPYSYQTLTPNDGGLEIKMVNTTTLNGGVHAPARQTSTWSTTAAGALIRIFPDDIWMSVSDMSAFSATGQEFVLFTEPKEINLNNLLKEGEMISLATNVPVGQYARLKFNINYMRVHHEGQKYRIAMDQTVYISTNDSTLTTFTVESGMKSVVRLNFDIVDKVFMDRNGNVRIYPSVFGIYEGMSVLTRQ